MRQADRQAGGCVQVQYSATTYSIYINSCVRAEREEAEEEAESEEEAERARLPGRVSSVAPAYPASSWLSSVLPFLSFSLYLSVTSYSSPSSASP